jgi:hypothetical protein
MELGQIIELALGALGGIAYMDIRFNQGKILSYFYKKGK